MSVFIFERKSLIYDENKNYKIMKKELVIEVASVLISVGLCLLVLSKRKGRGEKENEPKEQLKEEPKEKIPNDPEELLAEIFKTEIESGEWRNERDFLDRVTKKFIVGAKEMSWIDKLPISQEELQTKLGELGFLNEYEKKLEEKYKK